MFPVSDGYGPPLSPPPRFTRVTCPPWHLARLLSPFFPFPPLRPFLCRRLSPSSSVWSPVVRPSEVFSPPSEGRSMSSPGVLSSVPYAGLHPPPDLCVWWYLAWVWVEGRKLEERREDTGRITWRARNPGESWREEKGGARTITDGKHSNLKIGTEYRVHYSQCSG